MKKLNETHFDNTYAKNRLKRFRTRNVQVENVEEEKFDLTLIQKDAEKFEKKIETVEENFEEKFKMLKKSLIKLKS